MYQVVCYFCVILQLTFFQVTELKAQYFEFDKEMRARIQTLQKQHNETVESLQVSTMKLLNLFR